MDKYFSVSEDKYNIRCKLYCDDPHAINRLILFGHGFGGHKDNGAAERFARRVLSKNKGTATVTFNWPCHGDDIRKKLRLDDCLAYLRLLVRYLREQYSPVILDACATSFGGYLFLKYIAEEGASFRKTALRCPAVDMYSVLTKAIMSEDDLDRIAKGKSVSVGFDRKIEVDPVFLEELRRNDITKIDFLAHADDILIVHGTKDEIIPFADVKAFAEDNLIDFIPVEDADHRFRDPRKMDYAIAKIIEFLDLK